MPNINLRKGDRTIILQRIKIQHIFICFCICGVVTGNALAETAKKTPEHIEGTQRISAAELIGLVTEKPDLVLLDSRIPGDRHKGYIETSVSLPDTNTNCLSLNQIIPSKNTPLAFYCNGVLCGRSAVAITIARECGYKDLYWYRAGFEDWMDRSFPYVLD